MSVIQLEIEDTLLQQAGTKMVKAFMERQLSLLRLQYQGEHIAHEIQQSEFDHQHEVEEARQEAWEEYKAKHLQEIL